MNGILNKLLIICMFTQWTFGFNKLTARRKLSGTHVSLLDDDDKPKLQFIDTDKPMVNVKSLDELSAPKPKVKPIEPSPYFKKKEELVDMDTPFKSKTFGSLKLEELQSTRTFTDRKILRQKQDLNGIQPLTPFTFATVPALMSAAAWQVSLYMAGHFAVEYLDADFYPVQRLAVVGRNVFVGVFTLAAGFCGVISVGLVLLGIAVTIGVAKGELDPHKTPAGASTTTDEGASDT